MERKALVEEVKDYFAYSDHWRRLCAVLQDPDPDGTHIHAYVETSVHPDSLEAIIVKYFDRMGWPSSRKIDQVGVRSDLGSLHGIEPKGKPHFDFNWIYKKEVGLRPCEGGESGCNLCAWNRWYINQLYRQFPFRKVGAGEEKALEAYFKSEHFLKGLKFPLMPTTCHVHINIHSSVHPDAIQKYAMDALRREGWEIYYVCPNVYLVDGKYRCKLVFMSKKPEVVFDIGWKFTPEVAIEPAMETWVYASTPGYDVWSSDRLAEVMKAGEYVRLSEKEIEEVVNSCHFPK